MLAQEGDCEVFELAVRGRQTDAVVRPKHPARFEPVAEFNRLARNVQGSANRFRHALHRFPSAVPNPQAMNDDAAPAADFLGVFGSPYVVVDGEPFWGVDRFDQVERWLSRGKF